MLTSYFFVLLWIGACSALSEPLLTALQSNGLSAFAQWLQEDPPFDFDALTRNTVIYAPTNPFLANRVYASLARRETEEERKEREKKLKNYHARKLTSTTFTKRDVCVSEGAVFETFLDGPEWVNLGPGRNQSLVEKEVGLASGPLVFTGLGAVVKVSAADIPFDNGVIRPISGILTLPRDLSTTLPYVHADLFGDALRAAGLEAEINDTPLITVFAPTNAVFRSTTAGLTDAQVAQVVRDHIVVGFPAYTPLLSGSRTLRTLGGSSVTFTVAAGVASVNGANIVAADAIIKNGVLHTVDRMLTSTNTPGGGSPTAAAPPPVVTGAATSLRWTSVPGSIFLSLTCLAGAIVGPWLL